MCCFTNGQEMRFIPLPALEDDPKDEQTEAFSLALSNARLTRIIWQPPKGLTAARMTIWTSTAKQNGNSRTGFAHS